MSCIRTPLLRPQIRNPKRGPRPKRPPRSVRRLPRLLRPSRNKHVEDLRLGVPRKRMPKLPKFVGFHNREGCTKNPCQFTHTTLSKVDKERQVRPARSGSPAPGKGTGKSKGRGKGKKGKSKGRSRTASPAASGREPSPEGALDQRYCHKFLLGTCTWVPCKFKHLTQDQVDKINKLQKVTSDSSLQ